MDCVKQRMYDPSGPTLTNATAAVEVPSAGTGATATALELPSTPTAVAASAVEVPRNPFAAAASTAMQLPSAHDAAAAAALEGPKRARSLPRRPAGRGGGAWCPPTEPHRPGGVPPPPSSDDVRLCCQQCPGPWAGRCMVGAGAKPTAKGPRRAVVVPCTCNAHLKV